MFRGIIVAAFVVLGVASEAPVNGPYAPSGWKPKGTPFILPQEFIPSALVRPAPAAYPVERENLDFSGQTNAVPQGPPNQYVPPTQYIPSANPRNVFLPTRREESTGRPNQFVPTNDPRNVFLTRREESTGKPNQYVPPTQYVPSPDPRNVFTSRREQSTDRPNYFFGREPSTPRPNFPPRKDGEAPRPNFFPQREEDDLLKVQGLPNSDPNNFVDGLNVNVGSQGELTAEKAYGPPEENLYVSPENYKDQPEIENEEEVVSKGQYYILTEDNSLQKVSFETKQSDKEAQDNTFTAELKYQPVEPIADPVYAYNKTGQLVRILRKK